MYWFVFSIVALLTLSLALNVVFGLGFIWRDRTSRARRIAQNMALSVFTLLVVVLLLELYFKLIFAQSDTFGFTLAEENWHARYVQTNSLGYRDIEWTPELLAGRTKIMVLGDSFVEGAGINNPADRFADRLGRMLGNDYAVMNVAAGGLGTKEEIERALAYPYPPDLVILSFYLNDIDKTARDMGFKPPALKVDPPALVNESYALNFFYWRVFRLVQQAGETYWDWLLSVYDNPDVWQVYQGELLQVHRLVQERGGRLIVVVFPEMRAVAESRPITTRVANLYREQGVPVLDVTGLVAGMDPAELVVNAVDSHPNEFVHGLVAEALYPLVLETRQAAQPSPQ